MHRRFIVYFLAIAFITLFTTAVGQLSGVLRRATPVDLPERQYTQTLVLLPLDSRPACTQLVEQLGYLANIRVVMPPADYLDNYTQPGNRIALAEWLKESVKQADAVIVSTDMLLSGSLIASRSDIPTPENISAVAELLTTIRQNNPHIRLYSFHIIPRLLIADHTPDRQYQKAMQNYSILQDQMLLFENPLDFERFASLEETIPKRIIDEHQLLYARNQEAHRVWMALAKANILDAVVIGQDDGYHFGLPNMVKQRLEAEIESEQLSDRVIITRGADEVALTLLGRLANENKSPTRVFVEYSSPDAPHVVMPFMSHSVSTTVTEKIKLIHAVEVESAQQADFILFVHIGRQNSSPYSLKSSAQRLKHLVNSGQPVALVDLAENFYARQTLLPYAIDADVRVDRLAAYAGWNTTSNSIGTAVTQAALYISNQTTDPANLLRLHYDNLTFLAARFLDDWHYLKEIQPQIDQRLRASGTDPYNLQIQREKTEILIRREMTERTRSVLRQVFNKPMYLPGFTQPFLITQIDNSIHLPWDRTFEIKIEPRISLVQLEP
ncbi:hypothetical protein AXX12_04260 [Anaerosporomusa subterranea]|uniref:DUF4127 family protein n=1 Tax=Anaerosporomusa subterranea TaxID=1794912 RepID=A0A154BU68_ANASB|nr:DUF4127 family protein [Anaerosporomusa subterranea]KYZ77350.1 hypothetical protein AXX12_04260 [Anaerosporomusa subterranea]